MSELASQQIGTVSGTGGSLVAAIALLAASLLVGGGRPGLGRLRAVTGPQALSRSAASAPPLRRSWAVVGALAAGALTWVVDGPGSGIVVGAVAGVAGAIAARRAAGGTRPADTAGSDLAGCWELLALCLHAGLPVAVAVSAAAAPLDGPVGARLGRVAGLLELGADPVEAWSSAEDVGALATFARAAGRSAGTGAALAQVARGESARIRAELLDSAQARAQRAAVLITGPLGLCFLPAFLVLGIAPVVIGLASEALAQW